MKETHTVEITRSELLKTIYNILEYDKGDTFKILLRLDSNILLKGFKGLEAYSTFNLLDMYKDLMRMFPKSFSNILCIYSKTQVTLVEE